MLKIVTVVVAILFCGLLLTSCEVDDSNGNNSTRTYEGCDGLSDLIDRIKTDGLGKMQLYGVVNVGDEDSCNSAIRTFNQPELLK